MNLKNFLQLSLIGLGLSLLFSTVTYAQTTTWSFTGIVGTGETDAGSQVSGSISFDPSLLTLDASQSGTTSLGSWENFSMPISGSATDGIHSWNITDPSNRAQIDVARNYYGNDYYQISIIQDIPGLGNAQTMSILTEIPSNGVTPTSLFNNNSYSNPNYAYNQPINWFSSNSNNFGELISVSTPTEDFTLTSVTESIGGVIQYCQSGNGGMCSVAAVPAPPEYSMLLVGLCMFGVFAFRRQRTKVKLNGISISSPNLLVT